MSQAGFYDLTTHLRNIETLSADIGGAVGPNALGNLDIIGGTNINTSGNAGAFSLTINLDDSITLVGNLTAAGITVGTFGQGTVVSDSLGVFSVIPEKSASGTTITTGAVTGDVITFALNATTPKVYSFEVRIAGYNGSGSAGAGFKLFGACKTDGAAATIIDSVDKILSKDALLAGCDATVVASGNNAIVRVTGVAGLGISWTATMKTTVAPL